MQYTELCNISTSGVNFSDSEILCQFILDPTSPNLPKHIHLNDSLLEYFVRVSRYLCFTINKKSSIFLNYLDLSEENLAYSYRFAS